MKKAKALLWKTLDVGLETEFSKPSAALVKTGKELDRLYAESKELGRQNNEQFVGLREANIQGLFFGGILDQAWDQARKQSGILSALISLVGGYAGAAVDSIIDWLIDNIGPLIEQAEDWMEAMYEWWTSPIGKDYIREPGEEEWIYNPLFTGWQKVPGSGHEDDPTWVHSAPEQIWQSDTMVIEGDELEETRTEIQGNTAGMGEGQGGAERHRRQLEDMHESQRTLLWDVLNDTQTAVNKKNITRGRAVDEYLDANGRMMVADRTFMNAQRSIWVEMYVNGYMKSKGMRQVLARGTW